MKNLSFFNKLILVIVLSAISISSYSVNHKFSTIAEMIESTEVQSYDSVTIVNGVFVEYVSSFQRILVKDNGGDAKCLIKCEFPLFFDKSNFKLKSGDVLKPFVGCVYSVSSINTIEVDYDENGFGNDMTLTQSPEVVLPTPTKTSLSEIKKSPDKFIGKVISLDNCHSIIKGFNSYIVQSNDTLKLDIHGLDNIDYPVEFNIDRALFLDNGIYLGPEDYHVPVFKDFGSVKFSNPDATDKKSFSIDIDMQVLKKECVDSKNYIIAKTGEGKTLSEHSGMRILLNNAAENDDKVNIGDVINIKSDSAFFSSSTKLEDAYKPSLLTIGKHVTTIIKVDSAINYLPLPLEELHKFYSKYEFLPVSVDGYIELTDAASEDQKAHKISTANLFTGLDGNERSISSLVDISLLPDASVKKWVIKGILDFPLYEGASKKVVITPLSSSDFISLFREFSDIKSMVDAGNPASIAIKYSLNCNLFVTGVDTIKGFGQDLSRFLVFVNDGRDFLQLSANDPNLTVKEGDVISKIVGSFDLAKPSNKNERGSANRLSFNNADIEKANITNQIEPTLVTIAQLKSSDEYASKFVKLENVVHRVVPCLIGMDMIDRHFVFQGNDSIVVGDNYTYRDSMNYLIGNYYLDGAYTQFLPTQNQQFISSNLPVSFVDGSVYISNGIVYADNAAIVVYDILGHVIANGFNSVNLQSFDAQVYLVRTSYSDGRAAITKLVKK